MKTKSPTCLTRYVTRIVLEALIDIDISPSSDFTASIIPTRTTLPFLYIVSPSLITRVTLNADHRQFTHHPALQSMVVVSTTKEPASPITSRCPISTLFAANARVTLKSNKKLQPPSHEFGPITFSHTFLLHVYLASHPRLALLVRSRF